MYKLNISVILWVMLISAGVQSQKQGDQGISSSDKVKIETLLRTMTLDEKIGQLSLFSSDWDVTGPKLKDNYKKLIKEGKAGAILNAYTVDYIRSLQRIAVEDSRLKIPLIFGYDVVHGHRTIFPTPLAQSCSWDLYAIEESERIAAMEATAEGLNWTYAPMVDITRDPRWGRVVEGAGEDTWLGCKIAIARVHGFQGKDLKDNHTLLACAKHFAAYGAPQAGRDYNTVDMSLLSLYEWYLPPYKACVDAGVGSVMTSFNEIAGVPSTSNKWLLTDLLRKSWGFKGFVVTDYTSINELIPHGVAADLKEAALLALNAGVDMDMQGSAYLNSLADLYNEKKITMQQIDDAVQVVLQAKFKLGLFDDPYRYCNKERQEKDLMTPESQAFARKFVAQSCVLLKNQKQTLPIPATVRTIALIGPLGDSKKDMLGNWSAGGEWEKCVTLLEGIKNRVNKDITVIYEKGCNINDPDKTGFDNALKAASSADYVILALGEERGMSGEASSRSNIDLPGVQNELAEIIINTGKPVAVVLFNGRPLTITKLNTIAPAILESWFGGTQAGNGIADVLFGDVNPAGKLTMTFPRNEGQIPIFYNGKNTGRPYNPNDPDAKNVSRYLDCSNDPLFPFGYGLSYTTFTYSNLVTTVEGNKINVTVQVANSGNRNGEEVVQLYIRDKVGSVTRPLKELKGFQKVLIKKGETKTIAFYLTTDDLAFYHPDLKKYWEPGEFVVYVGTNSAETISKSIFTIGAAQPQQLVFKSNGKVNYPLTPDEETMLDSIQHKTFLFFLNEHHPEKGIVKDRTASWAPASIASTGFGIPSFAIGAERNWITREQAAEITLKILKFFTNSVQSTEKNVTGYKGFYYHFLAMNSGTREWNCELSSIDTGLLMMGIIFARNYYNLDNEVEKQIRSLAAILLDRIDWNFMEMPASGKFAYTISMGWSPEKELHDYGWSGYNEALFLYVLAAGSGMENVERSYKSWLKSYKWQTPYKGLSHVAFPPLFGHQFSQAFIDYRGIADEYMKEKGIDYFENSRRATYVQRQYAIDNPKGWIGYDSLCWGVTASDGPTEKYNFDDKKFLGYAGRGTSGPDYNYFDDGTIAPYASLSSLPFAPEIVLPTIKSMNEKYGKNLWGKYGYYDAFNPTVNWFNDDFIGIDQGPMLIMIENFRTGLVWNYVMKDPIIQKGLNKLDYEYLK